MFIGPECGSQLVLQQALHPTGSQSRLLRRNILPCLVLSAKQRLLVVFIQRVFVSNLQIFLKPKKKDARGPGFLASADLAFDYAYFGGGSLAVLGCRLFTWRGFAALFSA